MKEYSIYSIDLGIGKGHEQSFSRPAIVFKIIHEVNMCLVIPLTSNLERLKIPYTIRIGKTSMTNLKEDSVALVFQLRAVANDRITGSEIGKLDDQQIGKIKTVIKDMFTL